MKVNINNPKIYSFVKSETIPQKQKQQEYNLDSPAVVISPDGVVIKTNQSIRTLMNNPSQVCQGLYNLAGLNLDKTKPYTFQIGVFQGNPKPDTIKFAGTDLKLICTPENQPRQVAATKPNQYIQTLKTNYNQAVYGSNVPKTEAKIIQPQTVQAPNF